MWGELVSDNKADIFSSDKQDNHVGDDIDETHTWPLIEEEMTVLSVYVTLMLCPTFKALAASSPNNKNTSTRDT